MPVNLRELPIWLCWKNGAWDEKKQKFAKIPHNPLGGYAECNDPTTWCSYTEARAAVNSKQCDGYGLALSKELGLVIVDFDGCRDATTGKIDDWALTEIKAADSFTEISSSGTGVHILAWGSIPSNHGASPGCSAEIYDSVKMFWLTGNVFDGRRIIQARDLSDLHRRIGEKNVGPQRSTTSDGKKSLIARAPADRNTLMNGGWEENYKNDHSAADLALCNLLAKEFDGDTDKMDEVFRTSCLYRDKWEREDYRDRTFRLAIESYENWKPTSIAIKPNVIVQEPAPPTKHEQIAIMNGLPTYPIEIWKGTDYSNFAEICSIGNYIPAEFFIEAIKTVTGAVMGKGIKIAKVSGGIPRFYTVLIGPGGSGKGTAIDWATSVFLEGFDGLVSIPPLLWGQQVPIEDVKLVKIGACLGGFASDVGMQKALERGHARWLQTFEELYALIEKTGIENSGQSLLSANRQLYDREDFATTATGKRIAIAGKAQNTILGGSTEELYESMFAGKSVEGSGLFQRLSLAACEKRKRVPKLVDPELTAFRGAFVSRISLLETPRELTVSAAADRAIEDWWAQDRFDSEDVDEYGRINIIVWRNCLHLAWLHDRNEISIDDALGAIKLGDYQYDLRKRYKPASGNNEMAVLENRIRKLLEREGKMGLREAARKLNANRNGIFAWNRALKNLQENSEIIISETTGRGGNHGKRLWLEMVGYGSPKPINAASTPPMTQ